MSLLKHRLISIASLALLVSLVLTYGCGKGRSTDVNPEETLKGTVKDKPKNEEILAWIGNDVITSEEYKEEFAILLPTYRNVAVQYKDQFLQSLINRHLLLQEAKRKNLQESETVKRLIERAKEEIMIQGLLDRGISDRVEVTDSEIENHYQENRDNYTEPSMIRASHILVDSELIAIKVQEDLKYGANFADLAREYSLDIPTKDKGGDLGYFAKGELVPAFEQACEKLEAGEVSDIVKTDLGYHIIKIFDKKEPTPKSLEQVKDTIESELLFEKQTRLYENLLQGLREKQNVRINQEMLQNLELSP